MPRPRLVVRPPGTRTREEVAAELPGVPLTTLGKHLEPAAIGEWVPPGTRRVVVLYDASRIVELVKRLPPGRARPRRRRRRRNADPTIEYDVHEGWITLGDLARTAGRDKARVKRTLDAHARAVRARAAKLGEEATAALTGLFDAVGLDGHTLRPLPAKQRIVSGRRQWTYDEMLARAALAGAASRKGDDSDPWRDFCESAAKRWAPEGANKREQARLAAEAEARILGSARGLNPLARAETIVARVLEAFAAAWRECAPTVARRRALEEISRLDAGWRADDAYLRAVTAEARRASPGDREASARIEALVIALVGAPLTNSVLWQGALSSLGSRRFVTDLENLISAAPGEDRDAALRALRLKVIRQARHPLAYSLAGRFGAPDRERFVAAIVEALRIADLRGKPLSDPSVETIARKIAAG